MFRLYFFPAGLYFSRMAMMVLRCSPLCLSSVGSVDVARNVGMCMV